jgi:hypothetical protein
MECNIMNLENYKFIEKSTDQCDFQPKFNEKYINRHKKKTIVPNFC